MNKTMSTTNKKRGFTLIEVLVAVAILLVGVVAALYIFPPGFASFQNAQISDVSAKITQKYADDLMKNPDNIPDAIMPVDTSFPLQKNEVGTFFSNINAVDFYEINQKTKMPPSPGDAGYDRWSWLKEHTLKNGLINHWPLWQPLSVRVMRMVVGEKIKISSSMTDTSASGKTIVQKYSPLFSPLVLNKDWDYIPTKNIEPLTIYDLRYKRVGTDDMLISSEEIAAETANPSLMLKNNKLNYEIDYNSGIIKFASKNYDRKIRLTFLVMDSGTIKQFPANPDVNGSNTIISVPLSGTPGITTIDITTLPGYIAGSKIIPGSEQLNRAYEYINPSGTPRTGQYTFNTYSTNTNILIGDIYFSQDDAGKLVKIDYQVADWGILHEDVTVDDNGYLKLSLQNPKIAKNPNFPREPIPWGLFTPVDLNKMDIATDKADYVVKNNVVMAMVDMQNGQSYEVIYDPKHYVMDFNEVSPPPSPPSPPVLPGAGFDPNWKAQDYKLIPVSYDPNGWDKTKRDAFIRPEQLKLIDMTKSEKGILRVGSGNLSQKSSWKALRGRILRIYYRAARDWTLQVIRPPAQFWALNSTTIDATTLGWNRFAVDSTNTQAIYVSGLYSGLTLAIDYQAEEIDSGCILANTTSNTTTNIVTVDDSTNLSAGMKIQFYDAVDFSKHTAVILSVDSITQITLTSTVTVANGSKIIIPDQIATNEKHGEIHVVPPPDNSTGACKILLRNNFKVGSTISVRGMSISVRAFWIQERSGGSLHIDGASEPPVSSNIGERWTSKTIDMVLPESTQ